MQLASVTVTLLTMASGAVAGGVSTTSYDPGLDIFMRQSDDAVCCCCQANVGCVIVFISFICPNQIPPMK